MKTILTAVALVIAGTSLSFAAVAPVSDTATVSTVKDGYAQEARRKKRVPGGSGCDSARDQAEHPECQG